jgi:hypothetical protein
LAAPVYSSVLWDPGPLGPGTTVGPTVPDGVVWVVRDVEASCNIAVSQGSNGFALSVDGGTPFFKRFDPHAHGGDSYSWRGRQVVEPGSGLQLHVASDTWYVRICGYVLTLP